AASLPEWFPRKSSFPFDYQLAYAWKDPAGEGVPGFILFLVRPTFMVPSASHAAVLFLDGSGKLLHSVDFSTGSRLNVNSAKLRHESRVKGHVIDLDCAGTFSDKTVARQVYVVSGRRVRLLRSEDWRGELIPNDFEAPHHTIGPKVPLPPAEEWE